LLEDSRVDVNRTTRQGNPLLHYACDRGATSVLTHLLSNVRVDVNFKVSEQHTALHLACAKGDDVHVALLLAVPELDLNAKNQDGTTALLMAVVRNRVSCAGLLLEDPRLLSVNEPDKYDRSPLHHSLAFSPDIAVLLLSHPQIDVNLTDASGNTPLMRACTHGQTACVELLLQHPKLRDPHQANNIGETPLDVIISGSDLRILKVWISSGKEIPEEWLLWGNEEEDEDEDLSVLELLAKYRTDSVETRREMRQEVGLYKEVADLFAVVVFLCDGLYRIRRKQEKRRTKEARFFGIVSQLPMEMQMIVCHRVMGLSKDLLSGKACSSALKNLGDDCDR
jgi:hypothetical protein